MGNLAATSYLIEKNGQFNLKVAAPTTYGNYELFFAARADFPELTSIVNKALESITPQEHTAIRNKWLSIRYEYGISKIDINKWGLFFVFTTLIIGAVIHIWNKKFEKFGLES